MQRITNSTQEEVATPVAQDRVETRVDLNPIHDKLEAIQADHRVLDEEQFKLTLKIKDLQDKIDKIVTRIVTPEVKQITNVKDVSAQVMEHVEANHKKHDGDLLCHANHIVSIEASLKGQKILNFVLVGALIITILLHFK